MGCRISVFVRMLVKGDEETALIHTPSHTKDDQTEPRQAKRQREERARDRKREGER